MENIKDMTAVAINKALQDIENNKKQDLTNGTTEEQKKQRLANEENLNNELKRRAELLAKAKNSDNLTNKELKDLEKQVNELPDLKGKRTSEYYKPTNELNARKKEEEELAELQRQKAALEKEIEEKGTTSQVGRGMVNRAGQLKYLEDQIRIKQSQYNADNGINKTPVASNPPKNHGVGTAVVAEIPNVKQKDSDSASRENDNTKIPKMVVSRKDIQEAQAVKVGGDKLLYAGMTKPTDTETLNIIRDVRRFLKLPNGDAYDKDVEKAVLTFQEKFGLKKDGVVGDQTLAALKKFTPNTDIFASSEVVFESSQGNNVVVQDVPNNKPQNLRGITGITV
jgi:murein L,D-transpeptidase YcbB/YkuD